MLECLQGLFPFVLGFTAPLIYPLTLIDTYCQALQYLYFDGEPATTGLSRSFLVRAFRRLAQVLLPERHRIWSQEY